MADDTAILDDQLVDDGDGAPEVDPPVADPKTTKQIADLVAARDREVARANKAEAALKTASAGKSAEGSSDPAVQVLADELREASLDAVFARNPKLDEFGIDRALVEGSTRTEMTESATKLVALIEQVESKARNATLATHGLSPEPLSATRSKPVDYASMSKEDFEKAVEAGRRG